jgi:hypothetical protein
MTYFEDGTPYRYLPEFADGSVNIGWLDRANPHPTGPVAAEFAERLVELCRKPVNLTRGWHYCNLCPTPTEPMPEPITVKSPAGDFPVGHGEIRVDGTGGARYAAPDMIAHYVHVHGYRPPDPFVEAVVQQGALS